MVVQQSWLVEREPVEVQVVQREPAEVHHMQVVEREPAEVHCMQFVEREPAEVHCILQFVEREPAEVHHIHGLWRGSLWSSTVCSLRWHRCRSKVVFLWFTFVQELKLQLQISGSIPF